ncbi:MAG: hypothetical protein ACR2K1_04895 [Saprospiraceae bacterium]
MSNLKPVYCLRFLAENDFVIDQKTRKALIAEIHECLECGREFTAAGLPSHLRANLVNCFEFDRRAMSDAGGVQMFDPKRNYNWLAGCHQLPFYLVNSH